ncbi:hypothetical protein DVH24_026600 [Malus domestica]|uniref:Uncharacterized protein n=1 Tax=Malus domestica TaxID=3750 RepID=A0A498K1M6_MALDO|nr:hypothetical protein DVH24_026600 [Malus domestica]
MPWRLCTVKQVEELKSLISVIFWVPVYYRVRFKDRNSGFTQLQRIAVGLVISIFAMLAAGTLELVRLREV